MTSGGSGTFPLSPLVGEMSDLSDRGGAPPRTRSQPHLRIWSSFVRGPLSLRHPRASEARPGDPAAIMSMIAEDSAPALDPRVKPEDDELGVRHLPLSPLVGEMSPQVTEGGSGAVRSCGNHPPLSADADISPARGENGSRIRASFRSASVSIRSATVCLSAARSPGVIRLRSASTSAIWRSS